MVVFWIKAETKMNLQIILKMNMGSHSSFVCHMKDIYPNDV